MPVEQLIDGIHHFRSQVFRTQRDLFERLAMGQEPETLLITCSDSRIDPNLITHTDPGDLFVLRNAGNLIPAYHSSTGGESATIEFAVDGLKVTDIVVCGHSHCGAMKALLHPEYVAEMPEMSAWLRNAEATRRIVRSKYSHLTIERLLEAAIEENVLVQLENLQTHPSVAAALAQSQLKLHAWVYEIATGDVYAFDPETGQFRSLGELRPVGHATPQRIARINSGDSRFHP